MTHESKASSRTKVIRTRVTEHEYATPGFTLEKYGHSSERMKKTSAEHMEYFIRSINPNEKNVS